jgi:phage shock protein A
MSWLSQFTLIMRSNVTALREQIEDPEKVLHQLLIDMQNELDVVRSSVADAVADELLMRKRISKEAEEEAKWQSRATQAIKRGDEDVARTALEQRLSSTQRLEQYKADHNKQVVEVEKLKASVRDLEDKIRQAQHKKTLLVAKLARAKSTDKIQSALERTNSKSAFSHFRKLEDRIDRHEAKLEALAEMNSDEIPSDLEEEFLRQEQKERIEAELDALRKLASSESPL